MSKYQPLEKYLMSLDQPKWHVSFAEIEAILGFSLPRSAYLYPAWWANDAKGHSHAAAWLEAGWKTEDVDIPGRKLKLVRQMPSIPHGAKFGCMKDTAWVVPGTDLTAPLGEPVLAEEGRLLSE